MFKLKSPFKPTGDQPDAIKSLSDNFSRGVKHQTLHGVTGSGKTFTIANLINKVQRPTLVIAHNKTLAAQLADEFRQFFPENAVHYFVSYYDYYQPEAYIPHSDTYIEKDSSINEEIDRLRHATTHSLLTRNDVIVVASVSCIYGIGSPEYYRMDNISFKKGDPIKRDDFLRQLNKLQYQRNDTELKRGTFSLKGDTLEIFPAYSENSIRIIFFGDEVESISEVDWITGKKIDDLSSYEIFPAKHFVTPEDTTKQAIEQIREDLAKTIVKFKKENKLIEAQRIDERTNYDLEMIEETGYCSGIENYSRYFDGRKPGEPAFTLLDFFPKNFLTVIDESHMTVPQISGMYAGDFSRKQKLVDYGFRLSSAFDNRPLRFEEFYKKINQVVFTSATPAPFELDKSSKHNVISGKPQPYDAIIKQFIRPTGLPDPEIEVRPSKGQVESLIQEIEFRVAKNQRVLVTTLTKKMAEALTEFLDEKDIKVAYIHSDIETFERTKLLHSLRLGEYDVLVGINLLREGLDLPEVSLVAILDADKEGFLRSRTSLTQTIGRAARHLEGKVIMFADNITDSMRAAIDDTNERRAIQIKYNTDHHITPKSTVRTLAPAEAEEEKKELAIEESFQKLSKSERKRIVRELYLEMHKAADKLEFEHAARLRDQISALEDMI